MSVTKELIKKEKDLVQAGQVRDLHLHRKGTFIRAYDWSAWLACKYLHDFRNLSFVYHYGYYHKGITKFVLYPFFT